MEHGDSLFITERRRQSAAYRTERWDSLFINNGDAKKKAECGEWSSGQVALQTEAARSGAFEQIGLRVGESYHQRTDRTERKRQRGIERSVGAIISSEEGRECGVENGT
jgi:hypothetical protein